MTATTSDERRRRAIAVLTTFLRVRQISAEHAADIDFRVWKQIAQHEDVDVDVKLLTNELRATVVERLMAMEMEAAGVVQ